jgi:hypothetical protein
MGTHLTIDLLDDPEEALKILGRSLLDRRCLI